MTSLDSPSKQLIWELQSLLISQDKLAAQRDREAAERTAAHRVALAAAAAEHDKVRDAAEAERLKLEEAIRAEKERRKEAERRQAEREEQLRREQEAAERQRQEDEAREKVENQRRLLEKNRKAREDEQIKRRQQEEHHRRVEEQQHQAEEAKQRQARERQQREAEEAARRVSVPPSRPAQTQASQIKSPSRAQSNQGSTLSPQQIASDTALHSRYLAIHQSLKKLRKQVTSSLLANKPLKAQIGDLRRTIKKSLGQLTAGGKGSSAANRGPLLSISNALKTSLGIPNQPAVPLGTYLASPAALSSQDVQQAQIPCYFLYLLSIFSKALITQLLDEASASTKLADPLGIIASHVFASQNFLIAGKYSMIDVLLAKYHLVCPVLFITPPSPAFATLSSLEKSQEGRTQLLGWRKDDPPQRHYERQTGLGAGFAALSLRNYERSKALSSPLPQLEWWKALARICSLPGNLLTDTHCIVLKSMIEGQEQRILEFFGDAGKVALRSAVVGVPKKVQERQGGGEGSSAAKGLKGLRDVCERDKKLML